MKQSIVKGLGILFVLTIVNACGDTKKVPTKDVVTDTKVADMKLSDMKKDMSPNPDMGTKEDMKISNGVSIPGLSGPVEVSFDSKGVLHASCKTDEDCMAVQGYYHAKNRFLQMDIQRRIATGRLSGLVGVITLDFDVSLRLIFANREGDLLVDVIWKTMDDETKALFSAYTKGVNAWMYDLQNEKNGAKLSAEYDAAIVYSDEILPWTETDSIAGALLLLEDLSNSSGGDLARGQAFGKLSTNPVKFLDLFSTKSATKVATMPSSGETYKSNAPLLRPFSPRPDYSGLLKSMKNNKELMKNAGVKMEALEAFLNRKEFEVGSNNWVVGSKLTDSGNAMLANDPHLGLANPALWYLVELDAKTKGTGKLHIAGVSLPGFPGILLGHNEKIAWGGTVMYYDLSDVYLEKLSPDKKGVMFKGKKVPFTEIEVEFDVARDEKVKKTLRYVPHHGPVVQIDEEKMTAVTIKWTAQDGRTDINMFFDMMRANNVEEARLALLKSVSTNQNWVIADTAGDIAWYPYSRVPKRPWATATTPPYLPLRGDTGTFEWEGTVDYADLPQMKNPKNHFVATANTDPTGTFEDGDPTNDGYYLTSYGEFSGFRQQAVVDYFGRLPGGKYSMDVGRQMQADTYLVLKDWVLPHLMRAYDPTLVSADAQKINDILKTWKGTCPTGLKTSDPKGELDMDPEHASESIGCSVFHHYITELEKVVLGDDYEGTGYSETSTYGLRTLVILLNEPTRLLAGSSYFDDVKTANTVETKSLMLNKALDKAVAALEVSFGSKDSNMWRWGKVHTLEMKVNVLSNFSDAFNESVAAPSGLHAINVANTPKSKRGIWTFSHGPSMRHLSELNPAGVESYWTLPGGQTHLRDSPLYLSLLEDWLNVKYFKMPFTREDADAAAMTKVTILPQ